MAEFWPNRTPSQTQEPGPAGAKDVLQATVRPPRANRFRSAWRAGERIADFRRFFAFYIDLVEDPDFALAKDPQSHNRMMRDGQIFSSLRLRQLATAVRPLKFRARAGNETAQAVAYARQALDLWGRVRRKTEVIMNMLDAVARGLSVQELIWQIDSDGAWYTPELVPVHKDRFAYTLRRQLVLRGPVDVFWGEEVPPFTFMPHVFDPEPGSFYEPEQEGSILYGKGLFDRLYPWFFWKQLILRFAFRNAENTASGIRVGRYPRHNVEGKAVMEDLLKDVSNNFAVLFPSDPGYDLEVHQVPNNSHDVLMGLLEYIDKMIVKMILGSTLVTDQGNVGSYTLGLIHERNTFGRIAVKDAQDIEDTLARTLVPWWFEMNNWPDADVPVPHFSTAPGVNLGEIVNILTTLQDMGFPVSIEMVSEMTGISPPKQGEVIIDFKPDAGGGLDVQTRNGDGAIRSQDPVGIADQLASAADSETKNFHDRKNGTQKSIDESVRIGKELISRLQSLAA